MTKILALEAASEMCSVTLHTPGFVKTLEIDEARSHSKHFLPLIQALMGEANIALTELTCIACGNGPGSFTGLRICFGVAQGLAYGLNVPLLTVPSLESMAHTFKKSGFCRQERGFAILDARMNEIYISEFDFSVGGVQRVGQMQLLNLESAEAHVSELIEAGEGEYAMIGPGARLLNLPQRFQNRFTIYDQVLPRSSSVAEIALHRWLGGEATSADAAQICYLRNSVSWDKRKRIRNSPEGTE